MAKHYSYLSPEQVATIQEQARHDTGDEDDLWCFLHSILLHVLDAESTAKYMGHKHGDGVYKVKQFDMNRVASVLECALDERERFLRERASNDKSG